jgi:hypothetical protein
MIEHKNNKFIANFDNINSITEILSQNLSIFENISLILKKIIIYLMGKNLFLYILLYLLIYFLL